MRNLVKALVASSIFSLVAVASVYAMDGMQIAAKVPFSFTAGDQSFPAGEYTFRMDDPDSPAIVTLRSENGEEHEFMLTQDKNLSEAANQSKLVFEKFGNQRYLSQIWVAGMGTVQIVPQTEIQKDIERHAERHETVSIPAHKG